MSFFEHSIPVFEIRYSAWPDVCVSVRGVNVLSLFVSCMSHLKYSIPLVVSRYFAWPDVCEWDRCICHIICACTLCMSHLTYSNSVFAGRHFARPGVCVRERGVNVLSLIVYVTSHIF